MISDEEIKKTIGSIMKQIRVEKGLTQDQVAAKLKCDRTNIVQYETKGISGVHTILNFCEVMGILPGEFFARFSMQLSGGSVLLSPTRLKERLEQGCKELCAQEGIRCNISITINTPARS